MTSDNSFHVCPAWLSPKPRSEPRRNHGTWSRHARKMVLGIRSRVVDGLRCSANTHADIPPARSATPPKTAHASRCPGARPSASRVYAASRLHTSALLLETPPFGLADTALHLSDGCARVWLLDD